MIEEYFVDNSKNWILEESNTVLARVEPEFYRLEHRPVSKMQWVTYSNVYFDWEQSEYSMQAALDWLEGDVCAGYGLAWGVDDSDNFCEFLISAHGCFRIAKWQDGTYQETCAWTPSEAIRQGQSLNLLEVRRIEQDIYFLVNSELVGIYPAQTLMQDLAGHWFGFALSGRASVRAHFIRIRPQPHQATRFRPVRRYHDAKLESGGQVHEIPENDTLEKILLEVDGFVGLKAAKRELKHLANFARVQQWRQNQGLSRVSTNMHLVFSGAPGTGKTTFARLVGRLYKAIGVLPEGQTLEVGSSDFIAGYTGQTTQKVQHAIDRAWGGVLFIDEAYLLSGDHWYCEEALNVLVKNIEDRRDQFAVILAGYPNQMREMLEKNPGLRSRFTRTLRFESFSSAELLEIFLHFCQQHQYQIAEDALQAIGLLFQEMHRITDRSLGNGRFVRTVFERLLEAQAARLVSLPLTPDKTLLEQLTLADVQWLEGLIPVAPHLN